MTLPAPLSIGLRPPEPPPQPAFRELVPDLLARRLVDARPGRRASTRCSRSSTRTSARARASVWLHDRRARELWLVASSDPALRMRGRRVAAGDPDAPAARGLRLERPQVLARAAPHEPVLIAPLRGWRRALGTLVVEGARPDELTDRAAPRPRGRSRAPAVGRHRERPAPRGDAPPAAPARGHVQLARRSRRRHRSRAPRRADERRVCDAPRPRRAPSSSNARSPSSSATDLAEWAAAADGDLAAERVRALEHRASAAASS